jgi:hypothetical protein
VQKLLIISLLTLSAQALEVGFISKNGMTGMLLNIENTQIESLARNNTFNSIKITNLNGMRQENTIVNLKQVSEFNIAFSPKVKIFSNRESSSIYFKPKVGVSLTGEQIKSCGPAGDGLETCVVSSKLSITPLLGAVVLNEIFISEEASFTFSFGVSHSGGSIKSETAIGFSIDF